MKKQIDDAIEKSQLPSQMPLGKDANAGIRSTKTGDRTGEGVVVLCDELNKMRMKLMKAQTKWVNAYELLSQCFEDPDIDMKIQEYEVILYTYFEEMTDVVIMEKMSYGKTSIYRYRIAGIKKLDAFFKKLERNGTKRNDLERFGTV